MYDFKTITTVMVKTLLYIIKSSILVIVIAVFYIQKMSV